MSSDIGKYFGQGKIVKPENKGDMSWTGFGLNLIKLSSDYFVFFCPFITKGNSTIVHTIYFTKDASTPFSNLYYKQRDITEHALKPDLDNEFDASRDTMGMVALEKILEKLPFDSLEFSNHKQPPSYAPWFYLSENNDPQNGEGIIETVKTNIKYEDKNIVLVKTHWGLRSPETKIHVGLLGEYISKPRLDEIKKDDSKFTSNPSDPTKTYTSKPVIDAGTEILTTTYCKIIKIYNKTDQYEITTILRQNGVNQPLDFTFK